MEEGEEEEVEICEQLNDLVDAAAGKLFSTDSCCASSPSLPLPPCIIPPWSTSGDRLRASISRCDCGW